MFAAQIAAPRMVRLTNVPEPDVGEGQIKIRMEKACLCGSDSPLFAYNLN